MPRGGSSLRHKVGLRRVADLAQCDIKLSCADSAYSPYDAFAMIYSILVA